MRATLLLSLLIPALLPSQTAPPTDPPHVVIDTVGPDGWRVRLGPTNLGSMLESEQGRQIWQPYVEPMLGVWQQLLGDDTAYDISRQRILGYGGRVRAAIWFDVTGNRTQPASCIALVMDGDGRTDLDVIAAELRQTLYSAMPGEWTDREVGGASLAIRSNADLAVTAPLLQDDQLLVAATFDGDLELAMRRTREIAAARTQLRPDSPALRMHIGFGDMLKTAMANEDEAQVAMMRALGLDTVGDGTITIGTAGPHVQVAYAQEFSQDERGLFSAIMPSTPTVPSLLAAVGPTGTWTVGHFDLLKLYDTIVDAIISEKLGDPREDIKSELGIDLGPDLFAYATDEAMLWFPEHADFFDDLDRTPWIVTFRLQDEAKFRAGLMTMLPNLKPFFSRERSEKHGDVDLYRYGNMVGYDIWIAVGNGVFLFGGGRDLEDRIGELLDRCAKMPAELPLDKVMPAEFAPMQRYLPEGVHGYAVGDATKVARMPSEFWLSVFREFVPFPNLGRPIGDPDEEAEKGEALAKLLREHRLHTARSATAYADRTWRWRLFW